MKHIDTLHVTVADSWVVPANKTGAGNGEAKLYVGQRTSDKHRAFFGPDGFKIRCRIRKSDLERYLEDMQSEYFRPSQPYRESVRMAELWKIRRRLVDELAREETIFIAEEQSHLEGPRAYINSSSEAFQILRTVALPELSHLRLIKFTDGVNYIYEFRLTPDPVVRRTETLDGDLGFRSTISGSLPNAGPTTVERVAKARLGQQKFKRGVLKECGGICPFSSVRDESLLIASHIKPWSESTDSERLDPQNGLVFTPTYDRLFDSGMISFTDLGELLISPLVSRETASLLQISEGMNLDLPLSGEANKRRRGFLEFHRRERFWQ